MCHCWPVVAVSTRALVRSSYQIDVSRIAVFSALRTSTLVIVVMAVPTVSGHPALGVSAAIGATFVGALDLGEPYPIRWRAMLWATLWTGGAAWLGGLVSDNLLIHVLITACVAFAGGYAGALGVHGALVGLVSLVVFVIYSGTPLPSTGDALQDGMAVAAGGLLATMVAVSAWPFGLFGGSRSSVAAAYRSLALAWRTPTGVPFASSAVAESVVKAGDTVARSGLPEHAERWLTDLVAHVERIRLDLISLEGHRDEDSEALAQAADRFLSAAAQALAWYPMRHRVTPAATGLAQATSSPPPNIDPRRLVIQQELVARLLQVAHMLQGPWPRGRHGSTHGVVSVLSVRTRLSAHLHRGDIFFGHAVRLTIAMTIGTLIAASVGRPHTYWVPLTVAWLAKPDLAGTMTRIPARLAGTLGGVVIAGALVAVSEASWWLIVWTGCAAGVLLAFLWANYTVAVMGVTSLVLTAFALTGSDESTDALERVVYTFIAALLVLAVALIRPRRSGEQLQKLLGETCDAMAKYAATLRSGQPCEKDRAAIFKVRGATEASLAAALVEPQWRKDPTRIHPATAQLLLDDLMEASAALLTEELLADQKVSDPVIWAAFDKEIGLLEAALGNTAGAAESDSQDDAPLHPIAAPVRRARGRLTGSQ